MKPKMWVILGWFETIPKLPTKHKNFARYAATKPLYSQIV